MTSGSNPLGRGSFLNGYPYHPSFRIINIMAGLNVDFSYPGTDSLVVDILIHIFKARRPGACIETVLTSLATSLGFTVSLSNTKALP
ncbi:uncharacterized protein ARMOST_13239 [Armillaria ostoyae]|uniref:Uncharacterized protein n=1 Tax=Armillaria ostoyae TaxID=47428 RepID=A0A284RM77_ARMOS|nr:uncharacterized protein ARMOST_13239 [Armillaria ostoyae]